MSIFGLLSFLAGETYVYFSDSYLRSKNMSVFCTLGKKYSFGDSTLRARKFKKSPDQKNSPNQINQFHDSFFAISKMAKNQFLNWEKV